MSQKKDLPKWTNFVVGGLSGMGATCVVQPIDLIKTRMQLSGSGGSAVKHKNMFEAFIHVARTEHVSKLYKGLSAALLRQATYTTTRLGVFNGLMDRFKEPDGTPMSFWKRAMIGMTAGGVGAMVGNPAEVALIRMTADGHLPPEQRRNYRHAGSALVEMSRKEGILSLWRGSTPTVMRAMVLNMAQLASYSQAKSTLQSSINMSDGLGLQFTASMISGFISTAVSLPVDLIKTRVQMEAGEPGMKAIQSVVSSVVKTEGVLSFWKGFLPYYLRLGPHTVITFIIMERLNNMFHNQFNKS
eukprot:gb/GECH01013967.1/.p1 GENE.gb/GECH01013967.1/~~gb/GECH01013967.1/.p1  ORF type:complete len:300 (+),score=63.93 gb/GECH01013967.1/:1-900(+)